MHIALADCEEIYRAQEVNKRMKDKAAHACRHRGDDRRMGGRERRTGLSHGARHGTAKYNTCVRRPGRPWRFWHGSLRLSRHDRTVLDAMDLWPIRAHPETVDT